MTADAAHEVAIVGGGFFGCAIALHLRRRGFEKIILIEREPQLLARASYRNQARVHNGYHYPRSYLTAYRSRYNLPKFRADYGFAIKTDFVMLYAIAAKRSKISTRQFENFMREIGASYQACGSGYGSIFDPLQVAAAYVVEEYAFDACRLREYFHRELAAANVRVMLSTEATHIAADKSERILAIEMKTDGRVLRGNAEVVFNCTYACLNHTVRRNDAMTPLKHEVTEIALIDVPDQLADVGITVMDGPFFSCMPFPAEHCHSLSHVRYTPHCSFIDRDGSRDPTSELILRPPNSQAAYMIADAARLVPRMRQARWRRSLFEIKTVLERNEANDGRPIVLRREPGHARLFSLLGAKIDNIYDILARIDSILAEWSHANARSHGEPARDGNTMQF